MQKYEHYVLLIIGFTVLIIAIFNIITIVLSMTRTYKEGFELSEINLYDTTFNITDDVRLAIEQNMYNRQMLNKKDKDITSFEEERIGAEKAEFGKKDIDCVYEWSEWGECDATCYQNTTGIAEGEQMRTLKIKTPRQRKGKPCPDNEPNTQKCTKKCNVDCELDTYAFESTSCDAQSKCNGASKNADGTRTERYKIKVQPQNNGIKCKDLRPNLSCDSTSCTEIIKCTTDKCNVDCIGSWNDYGLCNEGVCNVDTGINTGRTKLQEYLITRSKENNGKSCETYNGDKRTANCQDMPLANCKKISRYSNGFPKDQSFAIKLSGTDACMNWFGGGNAPWSFGKLVMKTQCNSTDQVRFRAWSDGQLQTINGKRCIAPFSGIATPGSKPTSIFLYLDSCDGDVYKYTYDKNTGKIKHSSGKYLQANANWDSEVTFVEDEKEGSKFELINYQDDNYFT